MLPLIEVNHREYYTMLNFIYIYSIFTQYHVRLVKVIYHIFLWYINIDPLV